MIGQRRTEQDVAAVVVLIQRRDGTQEGWQVFDTTDLSWEFVGMDDRGTRAELTVRGSFYRMARPGVIMSDFDEREIGPVRLELEE